MITSLLALSSTAVAEEGSEISASSGEVDALEERLLGEIEEISSDTTRFDVDATGVPMWVFPLGMLLVVVLILARWKRKTPIAPGEIRILSKTSLGREGSLAVVALAGTDGTPRKLLLGLHGNSAPRLIDYLDADSDGATVRETNPSASVPSTESNRESYDDFLARATDSTAEDSFLDKREDLVQEILQARGIERYQQAANVPALLDEESEEDPWTAGIRNIYNKKSQ